MSPPAQGQAAAVCAGGARRGQLGKVWPLRFFPLLPMLQEGSLQQALTAQAGVPGSPRHRIKKNKNKNKKLFLPCSFV